MDKKLLVVDDSRVSRMMIISCVKAYDDSWTILEAASSDEALKQVQNHTFSAISLDINMPGRSGLDIVPELQALQPEMQIALLTANIQKSVSAQAEKMGITFVPKPVTEDKVNNLMKQIEAAL